jgi:hypothetical protein
MVGNIDLWKVESYLYAWVDAEGMRENSKIEKRLELGNNHFVQVRINNFTKKSLSNHSEVKTSEFVFSLNFWKNGQEPWFRVDNESVGYLHFHKDNFNEHQKLEETYKLSELISFAFDWTYKILKEKFPNEPIKDSSGFLGCA